MAGTVLLNGKPHPRETDTVGAFMARLGYGPDQRGVAVALNDQVVPRSAWADTALVDGDRLEIVEPVQGG